MDLNGCVYQTLKEINESGKKLVKAFESLNSKLDLILASTQNSCNQQATEPPKPKTVFDRYKEGEISKAQYIYIMENSKAWPFGPEGWLKDVC